MFLLLLFMVPACSSAPEGPPIAAALAREYRVVMPYDS